MIIVLQSFKSTDCVLRDKHRAARAVFFKTVWIAYCYYWDVWFFAVGPWCFAGIIDSKNYQGRVNITATGNPCQRWDAQQPHAHSVVAADIPDDSLEEAANYCRSSDGAIWPWCYTLTSTRWEYCSIQDIVCRKYQIEDVLMGSIYIYIFSFGKICALCVWFLF